MPFFWPAVDFYFSDSNLPVDKFLFTQTLKDPAGWVDLKLVSSFKRMEDNLKTYGLEWIAYSVRSAAEIVQVNDAGTRIRRQIALKKDTTAWERSVYVKGFGEGETGKNSQEQVEDWFKQFGHVNAVRFRRQEDDKGHKKGPFKGSVFVEFKTIEDAKAFVDKEPKPEFEGEAVTAMTKWV